MKKSAALACLAALVEACASGAVANHIHTVPAQRPLVRGEEFRVVASPVSGGGDAYDAAMLFERATAAMREQRCDDAIALYERLIREFPDNSRAGASHFNRGVCLQHAERLPEAADAMRAAAHAPRDPELSRDALFRLAVIGERAQRPAWVLEAVDALLSRPVITLADRVEALARRAAALLAQGDREGAELAAQQVVTLAPTPDAVANIGDDTYAAEARVILGEVSRLRAADVVYRVEEPNAEDAITRRVQLVTHAHVLFNDAIRAGNPHWAAAAGFRIGEMYRDLFRAIVEAPLPGDWGPAAREIYRRHTSERLRPLLEGALRSWEATLAMARRNGISDNEWVRRADSALEDLRALILVEAPEHPRRAAPPPAPSVPTPSTAGPPA